MAWRSHIRFPRLSLSGTRTAVQIAAAPLGLFVLTNELLIQSHADSTRLLVAFALIGLPFPLAADKNRERPPDDRPQYRSDLLRKRQKPGDKD